MWQSCNELGTACNRCCHQTNLFLLGYFQTASNNSLRSDLITLQWHEQVCEKLFGNGANPPRTEFTNTYYGYEHEEKGDSFKNLMLF